MLLRNQTDSTKDSTRLYDETMKKQLQDYVAAPIVQGWRSLKMWKINLVLIFHMQAESSSPDVTNIDESGENRQQRTPNLEGWTKLHKTEHVWKINNLKLHHNLAHFAATNSETTNPDFFSISSWGLQCYRLAFGKNKKSCQMEIFKLKTKLVLTRSEFFLRKNKSGFVALEGFSEILQDTSEDHQ